MQTTRLRIGEVARAAGVNIETLRYYERRGLLKEPSRTDSGYRQYPADTVQIIRFIKRAQDLGFTLADIQDLLELRKEKPRSRDRVRTIASAKIADIDEKIRQLSAMRSALEQLVDTCTCKGQPLECPILEALDEDMDRAAKQKS